jgi:hypothetical protein
VNKGDHVKFKVTGSDWTVLRTSSVEPAIYCKQGFPKKWGGNTNWFYTDELMLVEGDNMSDTIVHNGKLKYTYHHDGRVTVEDTAEGHFYTDKDRNTALVGLLIFNELSEWLPEVESETAGEDGYVALRDLLMEKIMPAIRPHVEGRRNYTEALVVFRDLCDDTVTLENEYVRGGVNLLADLFGVIEQDTGERMEDIVADLERLPIGVSGLDDLRQFGVFYDRHAFKQGWRHNSAWDGRIESRFSVHPHREPDPNEEEGWEYKLEVTDNKYLDSDNLPVTAISGGSTWQEAGKRAGDMIDKALKSTICTFV